MNHITPFFNRSMNGMKQELDNLSKLNNIYINEKINDNF